jgi:hypothetical protein
MPSKSLEFFISTPHWLDAYTPPLQQHLEYLAGVIRHILEGKPAPAPVPLPKPKGWMASLGLNGSKWKLALTLSFTTMAVIFMIGIVPNMLNLTPRRGIPAQSIDTGAPQASSASSDALTSSQSDGAASAPPSASAPASITPVPTPSEDVAVVAQFYHFLGNGDGAGAAGLVVPEKRESGPLSAPEIARFYGSLSRPLELYKITQLTDGRVRVHYGYSASSGSTCDGVAFVTVSHDFATPLILKISAPSGC